MRRLLGACALALSLLFPMLLAAAPVGASGDFCETDPLAVIRTPGGHSVALYVDITAQGLMHQSTLSLASIKYTVAPALGGTATYVYMNVTVPNDAYGSGYATAATVTSGPNKTGTVYGTATGVAGTAMLISPQPFLLNVR